jgi:hypothetical protein
MVIPILDIDGAGDGEGEKVFFASLLDMLVS